jgi:glycosyltransferase involved in cell wall biosynthesis
VVAGGGDDEPRLREKARALGLDRHVRFEGLAGPARLAELYRTAAFFVMPSRGEGFGLVYLEAMRAGLPCIAAPGAAEEIVEHGVSGLIADPREPGALAGAIVRLFADPRARAAMGAAARACVAARFDGFSTRLRALLEIPEHAC